MTQAVWVFPVVNRSHSRVVLRIGLMLQKVEIFENNRGKPPSAVMLMPFFWASSMAFSTLRLAVLKAAQHFWHKAGIDVGPFDRFACQARDFHMLDQLRRSTAPNIQITLCNVIETQLQSLTPSSFKTGGMSDQTKHVLPTVVLKSRNLNRINQSGDGFAST